jgi:HSP20 family protein
MAINDLIPWKWGEKKIPVERVETDPVYALQRDMDRWFGDFFSGFDLAPFRGPWPEFNPKLDVVENDQEFKVLAELPGLDQNDIQVSLDHNELTISGEKKEEKEDKQQNYYHLERAYGSFRRSIQLPVEVDADKIDATFKNGVLNIVLPKTAESRRKRITIKAS